MAQDITLMGASYSDVPAVTLPKTGGGTARFDDTSDANATASDILSGKTAYVNGAKVTGTGSGGSQAAGSIRFIDYDGTIVATYSSVPESLPSVPTHTGLTNGTWNYTLAQITSQFNSEGSCDVGANYSTVSGATEIDIELPEGRLHPYLSIAVKGEVEVDWGDNTTPDTVTGTSLTTRKTDVNHEYASAGSYTIKISRTSGDGYSLYPTTTYTLLNKSVSSQSFNHVYANCVKAVRMGSYAEISTNAFYRCQSLKTVSLPGNLNATASTLAGAFYYCYSLLSVSLPSTISNLGSNIFSYCYSLRSVSIPYGISTISSNAFYNCYSIKSISLPSGVTSIESNAFYYCYVLESFNLPSGVTNIGSGAFGACRSLESINLPSGITSIGGSTFTGCSSLRSINLPSGVTSIGNSAFNSCYALKSISIPNGVTSIGNSLLSNCYSLESATLPSGITSIAYRMFESCYSLESVEIPSGVTSIGYACFYNCQSLRTIDLPSNLTTISADKPSNNTLGAFYSCIGLASITIPAGVTEITKREFYNCGGVKEYHFLRTESVPTLASEAFYNIPSDCVIYVPASKLEDYQTAENWSVYASYMVGE